MTRRRGGGRLGCFVRLSFQRERPLLSQPPAFPSASSASPPTCPLPKSSGRCRRRPGRRSLPCCRVRTTRRSRRPSTWSVLREPWPGHGRGVAFDRRLSEVRRAARRSRRLTQRAASEGLGRTKTPRSPTCWSSRSAVASWPSGLGTTSARQHLRRDRTPRCRRPRHRHAVVALDRDRRRPIACSCGNARSCRLRVDGSRGRRGRAHRRSGVD